MNRVTDLALQNLTLANLQMLQGRIADRNIQVSTGKISQRFSGIAPDARRLVNLEAVHSELTQFVANNQLADTRLQSMESAVSQIFDIASEFRTTMSQALNTGNVENMALNQTAQNLMEQVASLLNVKENGRYLFAGSKTDTAPVDLKDPNFLPPPAVYPGSADTSYYQGDTQKLSVRADKNLTVTYGVTADETGFEEIIRALHLAATATTNPVPDTTRLNEAMRVVVDAIKDIPQILSRIGAARASLDGANKAHDEALLYAEQTIGDLENVDLTKAITLLTADQNTLQASFAAIAQARNVTLVNFL